MKYISTYEKIQTINYFDLDKLIDEKKLKIKVGDYVVLIDSQENYGSEIGQVTEIDYYVPTFTVFLFDRKTTKWFYRNEIIFHSKNWEDVEMFLSANKYNL